MKAITCVVAVLGVLSTATSTASSKSRVTTVDATGVQSRNQVDRGAVHVFAIDVPREVAGARLDMVLLEFQVDVALDEAEHPDMTPSVAAYPLQQSLGPTGIPLVSKAFASARNVRAGNEQVLLVDITDIVRRWVDEPSSNHGIAVGSFTGPKLTKVDLKSNFVGAGKVARVTYYYQNRFGEAMTE